MKPVEEAFASATFRRVILPGIVLTVGLHPLLSRWLPRLEAAYGINATVLLVAEVLFLGFVVSSAIQWIYYLYEGFRLPALTALAGRVNARKVGHLQQRRQEIQAGRALEELSPDAYDAVCRIYEDLSDFPLRRTSDGTVERYAYRPTRLGNIIATYELYAKTRYGVDGVHYWYHLLNLAPESARRQFDEQYSFAESLVLTSFTGAVVFVFHLTILVGFGMGRCCEPLVILPFGPSTATVLASFGAGVWLLFYRVALPEHRAAGAMLRSMVDAAMPEFLKWIRSVKAPVSAAMESKIDTVTEYLKALNE